MYNSPVDVDVRCKVGKSSVTDVGKRSCFSGYNTAHGMHQGPAIIITHEGDSYIPKPMVLLANDTKY